MNGITSMLKSLISKVLGLYDSPTEEQVIKTLKQVNHALSRESDKPKLFFGDEFPKPYDGRVRALKYIQSHPKTSFNGLKCHIKPRMLKRLVECSVVAKVTIKSKNDKKHQAVDLFTITDDGREVLSKANFIGSIDDFISAVKKSGSKTLDEFDVNMTLFGDRRWVDPGFLKSVGEACWNDGHGFNSNSNAYGNFLSRKLQWGVPFMKDIIEKHTTHESGFLLRSTACNGIMIESNELPITTMNTGFSLV